MHRTPWVVCVVLIGLTGFWGRSEAQSYGYWFTQKASKPVPFGKSIPIHGAASKFKYAPPIPVWPTKDWKLVESRTDPGYKEPSRHCGTSTECLKAADFAFFLTELRLPKGASVGSFALRASKFDEGLRTTIFNARYPKGVSPPQGYLRQDQMRTTAPDIHTATTGDMASYLDPNSPNIIVITVLDDCCSAIALDKVELLLDGKVLRSRNNAPFLRSVPPPYALTHKAFRYRVRMWDYDGDAVQYRLTQGPQGAAIEKHTGWLTWQAPAAQLGDSISFAVEACDAKSACRSHSWSVVVSQSSQNQPPAIVGLPLRQVQPQRSYRYPIEIQDPNRWDWVELSLLKKPDGAAILYDVDKPIVGWLPPAGSAGSSVPFVLRACDLEGACVERSWLVTVTPNRPPKISNFPPKVAVYGQEYHYTPTVFDPDVEEKFRWKMIDGPPVYFYPVNGRILWIPKKEHQNKTWEMVMEVCDRDGECVKKQWQVRVEVPVVEFRVTSNPPSLAKPGQAYRYALELRPQTVSLDGIDVQLKQAPATARYDAKSGALTWTPGKADAGQKRDFELSLCKQGKCITHSWQVEVAAFNEEPLLTSKPPAQGYMLTPYVYAIEAKDRDSKDPLYYKLLKGPEAARLDISTGVLRWTPGEGDAQKSFAFSVAACDLNDACVTQSWSLPVSRNRPPQITSTPGHKATCEVAYRYAVVADDPDQGDVLQYKLERAPQGAKLHPDTHAVEWIPAFEQKQFTAEFKLSVCDGEGVCDSQSWKVEVDIPNKEPQITSRPATEATQKQVYRYSIEAQDPNVGDALSLSLQGGPDGARIEGAVLLWTPTAQQVGIQRFSLEVCDGQKACSTQQWEVSVKAAPKPPTSTGCKDDDACGPQQVCGADGKTCEPKPTTPPPPTEPTQTGCSTFSASPPALWPVLLCLLSCVRRRSWR